MHRLKQPASDATRCRSSCSRSRYVRALDKAPNRNADYTFRTRLQSHDTSDPYQSYKVFVALLDKWEIGYPLSQAFALDSLAELYASKGLEGEEDTVSAVLVSTYIRAHFAVDTGPDYVTGDIQCC
jgi:hypothetical protein